MENYPYGTRVQDDVISLNVPDLIRVHGIFESADTSDPSAPKVTLSSIATQSTTTNELIIGEYIVGQDSEAVAIVAEKLTNNQISFVYRNELEFKEGETVTFQESGAQADISTIDAISFDILDNYNCNSGGEITFYNYATINRKQILMHHPKK